CDQRLRSVRAGGNPHRGRSRGTSAGPDRFLPRHSRNDGLRRCGVPAARHQEPGRRRCGSSGPPRPGRHAPPSPVHHVAPGHKIPDLLLHRPAGDSVIGPLIRYLRILAGLSHYDLARMSNATVSQTHVAEADRSNDPELILALLYTLGIDPDPAVIDTVCALADRADPRYLGWMPATLGLAAVHGPLRDIDT